MFYILDLSFLPLSAIEFLRNSAIQVKFIIIIIMMMMMMMMMMIIMIMIMRSQFEPCRSSSKRSPS